MFERPCDPWPVAPYCCQHYTQKEEHTQRLKGIQTFIVGKGLSLHATAEAAEQSWNTPDTYAGILRSKLNMSGALDTLKVPDPAMFDVQP